ncbi:MAG: serine/threonine protein kinase [Acidobacteria bacterium]|nr:serine/threonine protein kinase [Acidobacteriota bacterium]
MMACATCASEIPESSRFCLSCGMPTSGSGSDSLTPTRLAPAEPAARRTPAGPAGVSRAHTNVGPSALAQSSVDHGRFTPGEMVADRYRVIEQIGKGGMGEVYRADDLKLAQQVALKFLPPAFESDPSRLERFLGEVRIARQISHANVCRVYDVGEVDGQHFLSMEYVDGEDLATLLKRIGRFPSEKATEIARQICAGLAAAHDKGVLHRDLKPANVMLDGRCKVRIADFGLAALAGEIDGREVRAGTPAYMAPEQLSGKEVTVRSDIYSLGLVLYELYTGKPAFSADTIPDLQRLQTETTPASVTSLVQECDPAVERVILRCLSADPALRPASALAVAAALPGGDPLAAALAAGETPSPEMVAAAGDAGGLKPKVAWICLGLFVASLAAGVFATRREELFHRVPFTKTPDYLVERAHEILRKIGYTDPPADSKRFLGTDGEYLDYVAKHDSGPRKWDALSKGQPSAVALIYRQSPRLMEPLNRIGVVGDNDPPPILSGMASVQVDTEGRLIHFAAVPPQKDESEGPFPDPDWKTLLAEAGFDVAKVTPVRSTWAPLSFADSRAAWETRYDGIPDLPVRIEAAAYHGKPIYFELLHPWTRPARMEAAEIPKGVQIGSVVSVIFLLSALVGAIYFARRNIKSGRDDRKGAFRFAQFVFLGVLATWVLSADHTASVAKEFSVFQVALGRAAFPAGIAWLLYVALEPIVRRHWPDSIISWTRLLAGRFNDPMVGRDLLLGALLGTSISLAATLLRLSPEWFGMAGPKPSVNALDVLLGPSHLLTETLVVSLNATLQAIILLYFMVTGLVFSRGNWKTSIAVFFTIGTVMEYLFNQTGILVADVGLALVISAAITFALARLGLFALIVTMFFLTWNAPVPDARAGWYDGTAYFALAILVAIAAHGFYRSLGGQPLFGARLPEA